MSDRERAFPEGFLWGTAISSFQVEMGRGKPIDCTDWWAWVHDKTNIDVKRVSGDTPTNGPGFWELYDQDFEMAKEELASNTIRLSIDWGRLFPESTRDVDAKVRRDLWNNVWEVEVDKDAMDQLSKKVDHDAVERYREIINSAKSHGLTPMVTLYHWPIPLWLHDPIACRDDLAGTDKKGWLMQDTIVEFAKYSAYVAKELGDIIDLYCTLNEPRITSEHGYLTERGEFPPGLNDPSLFLLCLKHLAIAHGVSYQQVKRWDQIEASSLGPATVGIVAVLQTYEPNDPKSPEDVWWAKYIDYVYNEWNLNAVFRGDYDMNLNQMVEPWEQMPHQVKGCDYIGVNYYSNWHVKHKGQEGHPLLDFEFAPCTGDCTDYGWEIHPKGLRHVVNWAYQRYRRPIYVTENGVADAKDDTRVRYLTSHLDELQKAIQIDEVPVKGYYYWSLMDNMEWADGYKVQFGLYRVDRKTKERTPTKAVKIFREIASANRL
ncbi:MAG: glycoside hydrolase family 1 protein [Candidatus Bathyarchaeota archaeon]|nr:glycoside hydrolase family 1 protein [Candidatus Bathyarchaeota archaeon]